MDRKLEPSSLYDNDDDDFRGAPTKWKWLEHLILEGDADAVAVEAVEPVEEAEEEEDEAEDREVGEQLETFAEWVEDAEVDVELDKTIFIKGGGSIKKSSFFFQQSNFFFFF